MFYKIINNIVRLFCVSTLKWISTRFHLEAKVFTFRRFCGCRMGSLKGSIFRQMWVQSCDQMSEFFIFPCFPAGWAHWRGRSSGRCGFRVATRCPAAASVSRITPETRTKSSSPSSRSAATTSTTNVYVSFFGDDVAVSYLGPVYNHIAEFRLLLCTLDTVYYV